MLFVLFCFLPSCCFSVCCSRSRHKCSKRSTYSEHEPNHSYLTFFFDCEALFLLKSSFCNLPLFLLSLLPLLPPLPQHISGVTLWNVNNSRCWHRLVVHIVKKSCAETIELLMYNNDSCIKEIKLLTKPWFCAFTSSTKDPGRFIQSSNRAYLLIMFISHKRLYPCISSSAGEVYYLLKWSSDLKQNSKSHLY